VSLHSVNNDEADDNAKVAVRNDNGGGDRDD
jgi:hypothetical protein